MYGFAMGTDEEDDNHHDGDTVPDPACAYGQPRDETDGGSAPGTADTETTDTAPAAAQPPGAQPEPGRAKPDTPGGLDRFRKKLKPRSGGAAWQEDD